MFRIKPRQGACTEIIPDKWLGNRDQGVICIIQGVILLMKILRFSTWKEFRDFIDSDQQVLPVYWRGQRDPTWPLTSPFERIILAMAGGSKNGASQIYPYDGRYKRGGKKIWQDGFYQSMRDRYLEAFQRSSSGLRGPNPKSLSTEEWWALGRHYGLITPLLDWTEKPYIAAFFALIDLFSQMRSQGGTIVFTGKAVAIYRLFHNQQLEGDGLRVIRPMVDELGRLQSQRGLFTWLDSEEYFELHGFLDNTGRGDLLTQIILSDQAILDGLRDLDAHGIDYRFLFPDLTGAALAANTKWDII